MEFLHPNILYGLFAVAIPILVHLFNFRRYQKVYFSNVQMLKSIHKKTKKRSELKHLIVLITRILAIIAIVLAFAQPFIPNQNSSLDQQERQYVSIYLDNSFSMTHLGENGSLLNEAQNMALNILESYQNSDYFHLITNDMLSRHHRWFNKMEMVQSIMEIQPVHMQQSLQDVFQREWMLREQNNFSSPDHKAVLYLLSDFQKNTASLENIKADTNLLVRMIPLQNNPVNNLSVDSLWFENPVQLPQSVSVVHVKVSNNGNDNQSNIPLRLFIQDEQKAVISVNVDANESQVFDLSFTNNQTGSFVGRVAIEDYPIIYDDQLFFTFRVRDLFKVSMIYQQSPNSYLKHLFLQDSTIQLNTFPLSGVDYSLLKEQDLIILNEIDDLGSGLKQELNAYLEIGGQLLVIPSALENKSQLNSWLNDIKAPSFGKLDTVQTSFGDIEKHLPFFNRVFEKELEKREQNQKVDMPLVQECFPIRMESELPTTSLIRTKGNTTILSVSESGSSKIYLLGFPLQMNYSQLPEHALFVPIFYQMVLQSQDSKPLFEVLGSNRPLEIQLENIDSNQDEVLHLVQKETDWIPEMKSKSKFHYLLMNVQWPNDGIFDVLYKNAVIEQVAVNYNRMESDFSNWTPEDLIKQIAQEKLTNYQVLKTTTEQVTARIIQMDRGISLWKWFVVFAIFFIFVETILLRLWK